MKNPDALRAESRRMSPTLSPDLIRFDDHTRICPFPCALGASEPMHEYRFAYTTAMRRWVVVTLDERAHYATVDEPSALQICEQHARLVVGAPLHENERRLLTEAVRDVVLVRDAKARGAEYLAEMQAGHVAEIAS